MAEPKSGTGSLKDRLIGGERLVGTFVKTAHHQVVEILARTNLDFLIIDQEHAPFGPAELDAMLLAAGSHDLPVLVRIPAARAEYVLSVLDMGATGVLVPHVLSREDAEAMIDAAKYAGTRGFSASHRAADYGEADIGQYRLTADRQTIVIAQIEDREALDCLDEIMAADGLDCAFVGRADLMVSFGAHSLDDNVVAEATERIFGAARSAGVPSGLFLPHADRIAEFAHKGANLFVIGSDQSLLKGAAVALAEDSKRKA